MSIIQQKITDTQLAQYGVCAAPDVLTGTAQQNKAVFDRLVSSIVASSINTLIDALAAPGGADEIGAAIDGIEGSTAAAVLRGLKKQLESLDAGQIAASVEGVDGDTAAEVLTGLKAQLDALDAEEIAAAVEGVTGSTVAAALADLKAQMDRLVIEAGAVTGVFGRTGDICAQTGDYTAGQITAQVEGLQGQTVAAALRELLDAAQAPDIRLSTVTLTSAGWTGEESPYTQTVEIDGVTENSKIDLQPDASVCTAMLEAGTAALYIGNSAGILTAYAVGAAPGADLNIQCSIEEVAPVQAADSEEAADI